MTLIKPAVLAVLTVALAATNSLAFGPCCCFCKAGRCQVDVDVEEVDVKCFDIECEAICIPPLRFPWECGPLKKCGKVRVVKKLTTDKKKKKVCTYDWNAVVCCPDCYSRIKKRCGCSHGCCDGSACDAGCDGAGTSYPVEYYPVETQSSLPVPMVSEVTVSVETSDAEADALAAKYPEVSVALISAIGSAKPDQDGWVELKPDAMQNRPLAAEGALIE